MLVQAGANPLHRNKSGKTPLHIAIDLHSQPMVECLLSSGISIAALGPLYDEQVEWAKEMPWYSQLRLKSFDYSAPSGEQVDIVSACTVLKVHWMLHQVLQLPTEVVSEI